MTFVFICRKCSKARLKGSVANVCAYLNRSTAFPGDILEGLKCVRGDWRKPNWEYVEDVTLFIPVNFEATLSQEGEKKEGSTE